MDIIFALAVTQHFGFSQEYNEVHPHVRFSDDVGITGVYINSLERISFYTGYKRDLPHDFGIELALVTGYDDFVTPYIRGTYRDAFVSPAMDNGEFGWVIGYEFTLDK